MVIHINIALHNIPGRTCIYKNSELYQTYVLCKNNINSIYLAKKQKLYKLVKNYLNLRWYLNN